MTGRGERRPAGSVEQEGARIPYPLVLGSWGVGAPAGSSPWAGRGGPRRTRAVSVTRTRGGRGVWVRAIWRALGCRRASRRRSVGSWGEGNTVQVGARTRLTRAGVGSRDRTASAHAGARTVVRRVGAVHSLSSRSRRQIRSPRSELHRSAESRGHCEGGTLLQAGSLI